MNSINLTNIRPKKSQYGTQHTNNTSYSFISVQYNQQMPNCKIFTADIQKITRIFRIYHSSDVRLYNPEVSVCETVFL